MNGGLDISLLLIVTLRNFVFLTLLPPVRAVVPLSVRACIATVTAWSSIISIPMQPAAFGDGAVSAVLQAIVAAAPIVLCLETFSIFGRLIDSFRGAQFAEQLSPVLATRQSLLETTAMYGSLVVFWSIAGDRLLRFCLSAVPPGVTTVISSREVFLESAARFAEALELGLLAAAPVLVISLFVDLFAALSSRMLGRVSLVFELLPLKLTLGLALGAWLCLSGSAIFLTEVIERGVEQLGY